MRYAMLVWSALWRAQAVHLAIFAAVPGCAFLARAALGVVMLPFLLVGPGSRDVSAGDELAHLGHLGCWVALAPCGFADVELIALPTPRPGSSAPEHEAFLPMPTALTVRHVWFGAWLSWFLAHLRRRRSKVKGEA